MFQCQLLAASRQIPSMQSTAGCVDPEMVRSKVESPFLRLPLELRQRIYGYVFGGQRAIDSTTFSNELGKKLRSQIYRPQSEKVLEDGPPFSYTDVDYDEAREFPNGIDTRDMYRSNTILRYEWRTGILEVSKSISEEALNVLDRQRTFVMSITSDSWELNPCPFNVTFANIRRIRYVQVYATFQSVGYHQSNILDPELWVLLVQDLLELYVVAMQPIGLRPDQDIVGEVHDYIAWLDPTLELFSKNLPKTAAVFLDNDEHSETTALMDKHFPSRYEKVTTVTGDRLFERGLFDWQ